MEILFLIAVVVWIGSNVMSSAFVFASFREWVKRHDRSARRVWSELCCCQLCLSFYHSLFWTSILGFRLFPDSRLEWYFQWWFTVFAVWGISQVLARVLTFLRDVIPAKKIPVVGTLGENDFKAMAPAGDTMLTEDLVDKASAYYDAGTEFHTDVARLFNVSDLSPILRTMNRFSTKGAELRQAVMEYRREKM